MLRMPISYRETPSLFFCLIEERLPVAFVAGSQKLPWTLKGHVLSRFDGIHASCSDQ